LPKSEGKFDREGTVRTIARCKTGKFSGQSKIFIFNENKNIVIEMKRLISKYLIQHDLIFNSNSKGIK
jgi:hypothetical protein